MIRRIMQRHGSASRFLLATRDAHEVYRRSGFAALEGAGQYMEIDRRPTRHAMLEGL